MKREFLKTEWLLICLVALLTFGCTEESGAQTSYSFCDCVNHPPTTDAKLNACNAMIESMDPGEMTTQASACRLAEGVPPGGPDVCFCMHGASEDPEVMAQCEAVFGEMVATDLVAITRQCAAERVRNSPR